MAKRTTIITKSDPNALVGAAEVIDLTQRIYNKKSFAQDWQLRSWGMYEEVPESTAAADFMGDSFANYRLFIGYRDPEDPIQVRPFDEDALPEGFTQDQIDLAQDTLDAIGFPHGIEEIQRMSGTGLFQVGETWLLGKLNENGEEEWDIYSTEQITTTDQGRYAIKELPSDKAVEINEETDVLIRIWRRSPRFSKLATSRIKSIITILEELLLLTLEVRATTTSRVPAGMVAFPDSMEIVQVDNSSDDPSENGKASVMLTGLMEHFRNPIKQPGHASAVVPYLLKGHKDDIAAIRVIEFGRPLSAEAMAQRKECIDRFASSINLPAEIITGKGGLNHWGAWLIDEETQNENVSPLLKVWTNGVTNSYLIPRLQLQMEEVPAFVIGFERATKIDDPQQAQEDREDYDRFLLSDVAMRRRRNINEADAPTPQEISERILRKATVRETDTGIGAPKEIPSSEVASAAKQSLNLGIKERELRSRLQVSADAAMHRTLEKAGARVRSLAQRNKTLQSQVNEYIGNETLISQFGPTLLTQLNQTPHDLVNDGFNEYGEQWDTQVKKAQKSLVGILGLSETQKQHAMNRYDQAREQTKPLIVAGLTALATKLIFNPSPDAPEEGEFEEDTTVPAGMIRNSLMLAGGTSTLIDAVKSPQSDNGIPISGLYTSDISLDLFNESPNIEIESGFTWITGDPDRPFEPHQELSGESFSGEDDPALTNSDSFPDTDFYRPDDHEGCLCDTEPNVSFIGGEND